MPRVVFWAPPLQETPKDTALIILSPQNFPQLGGSGEIKVGADVWVKVVTARVRHKT